MRRAIHVFGVQHRDQIRGDSCRIVCIRIVRKVAVAVAEGVWVFAPDGKLLGILGLPKRPSNLAWCASDAGGLAITRCYLPAGRRDAPQRTYLTPGRFSAVLTVRQVNTLGGADRMVQTMR